MRWRGSSPISFPGNIRSAFWNTDCTFLLVTFYMKRLNIRNVLTIFTQVICLNYIHIKRYPCFSLPKKKNLQKTHKNNCTYVLFVKPCYFAVVHFSTECWLSIFSSRFKHSESFSCSIKHLSNSSFSSFAQHLNIFLFKVSKESI